MELVAIKNGAPLTTSLIIAEGTGNTHEGVIKLVRRYVSELESFGGVRFEIRPFQTAGGLQHREFIGSQKVS